MTHLISGLMSWVTSGPEDRRRTDLETRAKTEYKNDWQYAYHFMLNNPGKVPSIHKGQFTKLAKNDNKEPVKGAA